MKSEIAIQEALATANKILLSSQEIGAAMLPDNISPEELLLRTIFDSRNTMMKNSMLLLQTC